MNNLLSRRDYFFFKFGGHTFAQIMLAFLLCGHPLRAMELETVWRKFYDGGARKHDAAMDIAVDAAANVYVTGRAYTTNQYPDTVTLKYDSEGQLLWEALYTTPDGWDTPEQLLLDPSGNVYVIGHSVRAGLLAWNIFLLKYSADGEMLWEKHLGVASSPRVPSHMTWGEEGTLRVEIVVRGANESSMVRTITYDLQGEELGRSDDDLSPGLYPGGQAEDGSFIRINAECGGVRIARHASDGRELWMNYHCGRWEGYLYDIKVKFGPNRETYVAGTLCGGSAAGCVEGYNTNTFLLKFGSDGHRVWGSSFRAGHFSRAKPIAMKLDASGSVYVATPYYIVKFDSNGNQLWGLPFGGSNLGNFAVTPQGEIYLAGTAFRTNFGEDFMIARLKEPDVAGLARLTEALQSSAIPVGGVLVLKASVASTEPVTFRWLRWNGPSFLSSTNSTITVKNPVLGEYALQMTTSAGTVTSSWARVSRLPSIADFALLSEGAIALRIIGDRDAFQIESSTNLVTWAATTNRLYCGEQSITNHVHPSAAQFFRIRAFP